MTETTTQIGYDEYSIIVLIPNSICVLFGQDDNKENHPMFVEIFQVFFSPFDAAPERAGLPVVGSARAS